MGHPWLVFGVAVLLVSTALATCPHTQFAAGATRRGVRLPCTALICSLLLAISHIGVHCDFPTASSPDLVAVEIRGRLVFDDSADVALQARRITVFNGGEFHIGSCDCPFEHKATITLLNGDTKTSDPNGVGTKVIGVLTGGKLHFYGEVRAPTWTRLSATAPVGATSVQLQQSVQWRAGDRVIVVSSSFPVYDWSKQPYPLKNEETEERTVVSVSGTQVTLDAPLSHQHLGINVDGVDLRSEVGLLTRNILVQGDLASSTDKFGGHMMFHKGSEVKLVGVEITRSGQQGFLGRYPIHFHLFGDASSSLVDSCSIHHNYQRCMVFHGVHYLRAYRNVGYDTFDGIEQNNTLAYNLAVYPRPLAESVLLPSDDTPANFWIVNPTNHFIGNAAASSVQHCYWFAMPIFPTGPSYTRNYVPIRAPLGTFSHNSAHGCWGSGFHADDTIDQNGDPDQSDPSAYLEITTLKKDGSGTESYRLMNQWRPYSGDAHTFQVNGPTEAKFVAFTAWRHGMSLSRFGMWFDGGPFVTTHAHIADCERGYTNDMHHLYGKLHNSWIVGKATENFFDDFPQRGFQFYAQVQEIVNVQFSRFVPEPGIERSALGTFQDNRFTIDIKDRAKGIRFLDANTRVFYSPSQIHSGEQIFCIRDHDGSLTGRPPLNGLERNCATIVPPLPHLTTSSCVAKPEWNAQICPNHFAEVTVRFSGTPSFPTAEQAKTMKGLWKFTRTDRINDPYYVCGEWCNRPEDNKYINPTAQMGHAMLPLFRHHYLHFLGPSTASRVRLSLYGQPHSLNGDGQEPRMEMMLSVCFPVGSTVQSMIWNWYTTTTPATSLATLKSNPYHIRGDGLWYMDSASGLLHVRMVYRDDAIAEAPVDDWTYQNNHAYFDVSINRGGGGFNCPIQSESTVADVHRVVPPIAAVPALPPLTPDPPAPAIAEDTCAAALAINCAVSSWGAWSTCTATCGGGSRSRTRTVVTPPENGGTACPSLTQSESCNSHGCPVDCQVSSWTSWGACTVPCGGGSQTRSRTVTTVPANGGQQCPVLSQSQSCNTQACGVDCAVSTWSAWSACSESCGGGQQTRQRIVVSEPQNGGAACPTDLTQTQPCNSDPCPVHCQVSTWGAWDTCTALCGGGTQTRRRTVTTSPANGGSPCPALTETQECNTVACSPTGESQPCQVSPWSPFSLCSAECDGGSYTRTRSILQGPVNGGAPCPALNETQPCNTEPCPMVENCEVETWTSWSACSPCGPGATHSRSREILQAPSAGGQICPALTESEPCFRPCSLPTPQSPVPTPLDCAVSEWTAFSDCDCTSSQYRSRTVEYSASGAECPLLFETRECSRPISCVLTMTPTEQAAASSDDKEESGITMDVVGIPMWAWIVIGVVVLAIIGGVVGVAVWKSRERKVGFHFEHF